MLTPNTWKQVSSPARPGKARRGFELGEPRVSKPWRASLARPDEDVWAYVCLEVEADLGGQRSRRDVMGPAEG